MLAFSGAILGPERDVSHPTVAQIEEDTLILSTSEGAVAEWPLDQVKIIEIGKGYFEVVAADRKLSLVLDEPEAFEKALEDERALRVGISYIWTGSQEEVDPESHLQTTPIVDEPDRGSGLLVKRPRHGRASVRLVPSLVILVAVLALGYVVGTVVGDFIDLSTTESSEAPDTPRTEVVVRTLQGSENLRSTPFAVDAPWKVDWSLDGADEAGLEVVAITEDGDRNILVIQEGPGSGAATVDEGGVFILEIISTSAENWSVRVVEIANPQSR